LFNVAGALGGVFIGAQVEHFGLRRTIIICLALLSVGGLIDAAATSAGWLMLGRTFVSFGFVGIAVTGPRLVAAAAQQRDHGRALALWSIYMPAGMALAMFLAPTMIAGLGWRGYWLITACSVIVFIPIFWAASTPNRWTGPTKSRRREVLRNVRISLSRPGPWILAGCFTLYSIQWLAVMIWLPTFLIERHGMSHGEAATGTAVVVAVNILGNLAAGWLLHRGAARWLLIMIACAVMGVSAAGIFSDAAPDSLHLPLAILFSAVAGILPAAVFAACPLHAPGPAQIAIISGIVIQGSNSGALLGPPALAAVANVAGWSNGWWLLAGCALAGCVLALWLRRIEAGLTAE
jgi:MFS family permease